MTPAAACFWCGKNRRKFSEWEQEHHSRGWKRLCVRCAASRLRNPYNALLSMRKAKYAVTAATAGGGPDDGR